VQSSTASIIDVDNAAKAILDTLSTSVFPDDRKIQHLSVSRLHAPDVEGHYLLALSPVLPVSDDVITQTGRTVFLGTVQPPEGLNG
jgi:hypothetical protein